MKSMPDKTAYDVVIVNYNGENIISQCLDSVQASTIKPAKIIVYDNDSKDRSVDLIKKKYPHVILIEGDSNIGFGRGNNEAMKLSKSDFILFVNNDLVLDKYCSESLLAGFTDKKLAILNPIIFKGWGKVENQEVYAFGAKINRSGFGYGLYDTVGDRTDLNCFSGACFMARSGIIKKLQFEKRFFLYCEEPDLSVRILGLALKIGRVREASCYHLESYSSPQSSIDGTAFRQFYGVQNRWFMLGKHWPLFMLPEVILFNLLHLFYLTYFYAKNRKFSYLKLIYLAPSNLFSGLFERDHAVVVDKKWYRQLGTTTLKTYFALGKKVFTKS